MPNRILKESICTSDNMNELSPEEESFFYRLLVNCDDYGRFDARPTILRAKCFPLKIDKIKDTQIEKWLGSLVANRLIDIYTVSGISYLQVSTWERHQQIRAKRSKYPSIDNRDTSSDNIGNQMIADDSKCPRNPIQSNPNPIRIQSSEVSEEVTGLTELLKTLILTNDPKGKVPSDLNKWATEIDKINRIDGRSFAEIEEVIRFCQEDSFWKTNILSAGSLREKFSKLYLKMQNGGQNGANRGHLEEAKTGNYSAPPDYSSRR